MEEALGRSASDRRFHMLLFGSCAALGVLMAAVGLYGVLSYGVTQRRGEIGIRLALGASNSAVRGLILKQGMLPASIGIALGLLIAASLTRVMQSLLFHVDPFEYGRKRINTVLHCSRNCAVGRLVDRFFFEDPPEYSPNFTISR